MLTSSGSRRHARQNCLPTRAAPASLHMHSRKQGAQVKKDESCSCRDLAMQLLINAGYQGHVVRCRHSQPAKPASLHQLCCNDATNWAHMKNVTSACLDAHRSACPKGSRQRASSSSGRSAMPRARAGGERSALAAATRPAGLMPRYGYAGCAQCVQSVCSAVRSAVSEGRENP